MDKKKKLVSLRIFSCTWQKKNRNNFIVIVMCIFDNEICIALFFKTIMLDVYGWSIDDFDKGNAMIIEDHQVPWSMSSQVINFSIVFSH